MMRADVFNSHVDPVRTEFIGMQQIIILPVCDSYERKLKGILADEQLLQVCNTNESTLEIFIVDESSMEESKLESVNKSINKNKEKIQLMKQIMRNLW